MNRAVLLTSLSPESRLGAHGWKTRGAVHLLEDGGTLPLHPRDLAVVDWGSQVPAAHWEQLLEFHRAGGRLVVLGPRPFSPNGSVKYLRSLGWLDAWEEAVTPAGATLEVGDESWSFAAQVPPPAGVCGSGLWHLSPVPDPRGLMFDSATVAAARVSFPLRFVDDQGRTASAPVARLDPFAAGPIVWLNFDAPATWWASASGQGFLEGALACLEPGRGRYRLVATASRGRFRPDEVPEISWKVTPDMGAPASDLTLECRLSSADETAKLTPRTMSVKVSAARGSGSFRFEGLPEGFWKAELRLSGETGHHATTQLGFYHLSEPAVREILSRVPRLKHDPQVSTDVLSADGRPFPLHGVNYHVTDAYRECFVRYNAWQNDRDLLVLQADGYNVLRTGNWQAFDLFFSDEGPLRDEVLANLEAFFLTAARHGFQAQFVLGAFILNPWNRDQCPIFHPGQRAKVMAAFASFSERFETWPHVQIDALNEPSYSVNGAWHLAKPSEDERELEAWRKWLKKRYSGRIEDLWRAWGVAPDEAPSFATLSLPTNHRRFSRNYDRQDTVVDGRLGDWYDFARQAYTGWVTEIRKTVRDRAPETLFMLGRDESLRVPAQQDEAAAGNLDVVNFHQWHRDSAIHSEYAFNRVRGLVCCGQEMGTYPYGDRRNDPRMTESLRARILERKLAYSFGNWLQWQAWNDPYMLDSIERALGLYRADGTSTPLAETARLLARFDEVHRDRMLGLDENATRVLLVFPTASYFSPDSEAVFRTTMRAVRILAERLRLGFDVVLEHLLDRREQTGDPSLVIVPSALELGRKTWDRLTSWAREGKTVLITGAAGQWSEFGLPVSSEPLAAVETLEGLASPLEVSFRRSLDHFEPGTLYDRLVWADREGPVVREVPLEAGKLLQCPLPIEACDDDGVIEAVYRWAVAEAKGIDRVFDVVRDPGPRVGIFAQPYRDATRYTLVNEGAATKIAVVDRASGATFETSVGEGRAQIVWMTKQGEKHALH